MEQVSGLYNPGFLGSQFHWWLGQVADAKNWRENQPNALELFCDMHPDEPECLVYDD